MIIKLNGFKADGCVNAIPSKSFAHRIAICEFLANKEITAGGALGVSKDINATVDCLNRIKLNNYNLDCGESGSTLRFLIPLLSALNLKAELTGSGRLLDRPNVELINALNLNGANIVQEKSVKIDGNLKGGDFYLRGDISSQYISGLLMALPILKSDSKIILTSPLSSSPYVDVTISVIKAFNVNVEKTDYGFFIKGNQKYFGSLTAEGDYSNGAFFMALGALSGKVCVNGLNPNSLQGDKQIIDILKSFGAKVNVKGCSVTVEKGEFLPFSFNADSCPDLVPVASAIASFAKGKTIIKNVERLVLKESDRIESVIKMVNSFGIKAERVENDLIIHGGTPKFVNSVNGFNDHRIVMSACVMASCVKEFSTILGANAVEKSYPNFFEHYKMVGGKVYEV